MKNIICKILSKIKEISLVKPFCAVAIDGCGGAGKSTLARHIALKYGETQIIHMDDFYKPSSKRASDGIYDKAAGADYDIERLNEQVINPIIAGNESRYQRYDWTADELYSKYDVKIFVECNRELRLKRGLERDGESALDFWKQWMIKEDRYLQKQKPQNRVDFIISGEEKY